ncbi:MAG: choice-of-anchor D domain-containing protein [Gemmatimonadota bacterium]
MNHRLMSASVFLLFSAAACNGLENDLQPQPGAPSASKGAPGGGGTPLPVTPPTSPAPAPSGGTQVPPSPQVDGPAWFFAEFGGGAGPFTANVNFDALQDLSPGGISVGTSRSATELVFNVSKKTALTITGITFVGVNPGDFSIPAADLAAASTTVLPPNRGASEALHVLFTPRAEGPRAATLQVSSAAGIAQIFLTGSGLPQRPVLAPIGPFNFIAGSAPANFTIQNTGGQTLSLNSISIGGANPNAFAFFTANHGLSNCFAGTLLAPKSFCQMAVGLAPGATPPASATLVVRTNDPVTPTRTVPLTFTP